MSSFFQEIDWFVLSIMIVGALCVAILSERRNLKLFLKVALAAFCGEILIAWFIIQGTSHWSP